jgi:hypothetical protein
LTDDNLLRTVERKSANSEDSSGLYRNDTDVVDSGVLEAQFDSATLWSLVLHKHPRISSDLCFFSQMDSEAQVIEGE